MCASSGMSCLVAVALCEGHSDPSIVSFDNDDVLEVMSLFSSSPPLLIARLISLYIFGRSFSYYRRNPLVSLLHDELSLFHFLQVRS